MPAEAHDGGKRTRTVRRQEQIADRGKIVSRLKDDAFTHVGAEIAALEHLGAQVGTGGWKATESFDQPTTRDALPLSRRLRIRLGEVQRRRDGVVLGERECLAVQLSLDELLRELGAGRDRLLRG